MLRWLILLSASAMFAVTGVAAQTSGAATTPATAAQAGPASNPVPPVVEPVLASAAAPATAEAAPVPAATTAAAGAGAPLVEAAPIETGPVPLTALEMEACRRMKEAALKPTESSTTEKLGGTVAAVAGQVAGFAAGGPVGAALAGAVAGQVGKKVGDVVDGDDKDKAVSRPDPLLLKECEERTPASVKPAAVTASR